VNRVPMFILVVVLALQVQAAQRALPADGPESAPERILFGSCLVASRPHPILDQAAVKAPDIFVFTGDNIYADTERMDVMARKYGELAASPKFRALLKTSPVVAVWDDHDYGRNDAGAEYPAKAGSRRLFLDFWRVPADSPRRAHEGVYDAQVFGPPGKSVQVILLDTRYFRSPLKKGKGVPTPAHGPYVPNEDPSATVLGPDQWTWLAEQLGIPARLRIVVSSIQVLAERHGWESWENFPLEKKRLLDTVRESRPGGVVFLSGDRHMGEISRVEVARAGASPADVTGSSSSGGPGVFSLYDITSSGLNVRFPSNTPSANMYRVDGYYLKENFGMVEIDWAKADPELRFVIFDELGRVRIETGCSLGDVTP
jgi:alkaline phosphatase D